MVVLRFRDTSAASSPITYRWSPGASASACRIAPATSTYGFTETLGALPRHAARCGEEEYGWFGSFQGDQKRNRAPASAPAAIVSSTSRR